jgi:hypothetical protein
VGEDVGVGAAGFFEAVGEDTEAVLVELAAGQLPPIVDYAGQRERTYSGNRSASGWAGREGLAQMSRTRSGVVQYIGK